MGRTRVALAALAAVWLAATCADAQQPKPTPGCVGTALTDPVGDAVGFLGNSTPNLDVANGFFLYDARKGDSAVTANITVADLTLDWTATATGLVWVFGFDVGDAHKFVRVLVDFSGGPYFEYGSYLEPGSSGNPLPSNRYAYEGETQGSLTLGPNGVISMVVPPATAAKPGVKLERPYVITAESKQLIPGSIKAPTRGEAIPADNAPDGAPTDGGRSYTVAPCPVKAVRPRLTVVSLRLHHAGRGARMAIKLRSSVPLTKLAATLRGHGAVYGRGSLPRLEGTATLKLRLARALSKGRYTLAVSGSDATGAVIRASARVRAT
jgi:hypothetical protein